jgi:hypothetical protein
MVSIRSRRCAVLASSHVFVFLGLAWADTPPAPPNKGSDSKQAQGEDALGRAHAKTQAAWNKMDPRVRNLIDPEASARQYDLVEWYLRDESEKLLEPVMEAFRDDVVRLLEFNEIEVRWELATRRTRNARIRALIRELQDAPGGEAVSNRNGAPPEGAGTYYIAIQRQPAQPDAEWRLGGLRAELIGSAQRGEKSEGAKLAALFGVKPDVFAKLETDWQKEADPAHLAAIERYLRLHPAELIKHVASAYEDNKLTFFEYEMIKAGNEQVERTAAKARLNALIKELLKARK